MATTNKIIGFSLQLKGTEQVVEQLTQVELGLSEITTELKRAKKLGDDGLYAKLLAEQKNLKQESILLNKEIKAQQKAFEATQYAIGSYKQLNAQLGSLRASYRELSAEDRSTVAGQNLIKQIRQLDTELKALDAGMGNYQRNVGNYKSAFQGLGTALSFVGITGIGVALKETFDLAASSQLNAQKANTVFGDSLEKVTREAEANAAAMGLTVQQYVSAAAGIGDLLVPMGFQREEAANIATQLTNLSGALSEWSGGQFSAQEVTTKLQKAMLGEREELKSLGISISENDVSSRLLAEGKSKLTGEALAQAKAEVTLKMIMEKSTDAQTAYAKNGDSLLRKQAQLKAQVMDLVQALAKGLIPVFSATVSVIGEAINFVKQYGDVLAVAATAVGAYVTATKAYAIATDILVDAETRKAAIQRITNALQETQNALMAAAPYAAVAVVAAGLYEILKLVTDETAHMNSEQLALAETSDITSRNIEALNKSYANEKAKLDNLFGALEESIRKHTSKKDIIAEIQKNYGAYIGNIDLEAASQDQLAIAYNKANKAIIDQLVAKQKTAASEEVFSKIVDAERKLNDLRAKYAKEAVTNQVVTQQPIQNAGGYSFSSPTNNQVQSLASTDPRLIGLKNEIDQQLALSNALKASLATVSKSFDEAAQSLYISIDAAGIQSLTGQFTKAAEGAGKAVKNSTEKVSDDLLSSANKFKEAIDKSNDIISKQSIETISQQFQREREKIIRDNETLIRAQNDAIQKAANERLDALLKASKKLREDGVSVGPTEEEIKAEIEGATTQAQIQIQKQTEAIKAAEKKQLEDLEKSRTDALKKAQEYIANISRASSADSAKAGSAQAESSVQNIKLEIQYQKAQADIEFSKERADLDIQLAENKITHSKYQKELTRLKIAQQQEEQRIDIQSLGNLELLNRAKLTKDIEYLRLKADADQRAVDDEKNARLAQIKSDFDQGLLSQQQYDQGRTEITQVAEDKKKAISRQSLDDIKAAEAKYNIDRVTQLQSMAQTEIDIEKAKNDAIIAGRKQMWEDLKKFAGEFATYLQDGLQILQNFTQASVQSQTAAIEDKYSHELALAQGNAAQIKAAEERKQKDLAAIQKRAAAVQKAIALANATINSAMAIINILAEPPTDPFGITKGLRIAFTSALAASQIAVIATSKFARGGQLPSGEGKVTGQTHAEGGVSDVIGGVPVELEHGERVQIDEHGNKVAINKSSSKLFGNQLDELQGKFFHGKRAILSAINSYGNLGVKFAAGGPMGYSGSTPLPAPMVVTRTENQGYDDLVEQNKLLSRANERVMLYVRATNERIDRLVVVNDPAETVKYGNPAYETIKARTLNKPS